MDKLSTKIFPMDPEAVWKKTLDKIKLEISHPNFRWWFASKTTLDALTETTATLGVPTDFFAEQLKAKYLDLIKNTLKQVTGLDLAIEFRVDSSKLGKVTEPEELENNFFEYEAPATQPNHNLNPKLTLENFVVGLSNNLAFAAAQGVVANPGSSYNPLFLYGPSGVGKTHLMHGIGHALLRNNPNLKVLYAPSEKFMNDFVESIQTKQMGNFRSKYRNCDLFLIDDVQFISGRDAMQEEFFHTFNEIHSKSLQIVLTSDKPPGEIQKLEPRLLSRFQGGLMVDIQLPDFDTRMAILKSKLVERGDTLPEEVLQFVAETTPSNTRELEGKLTQILAWRLQGQEITLDLVKEKLAGVAKPSFKLDHKRVLNEINRYFNIKMADLTGPRRQKELVLPRQIAMYILYSECNLPFERVGEILGGRDHTTVMHGVDKIKNDKEKDREVQNFIFELMQQLSN